MDRKTSDVFIWTAVLCIAPASHEGDFSQPNLPIIKWGDCLLSPNQTFAAGGRACVLVSVPGVCATVAAGSVVVPV